MFDMATLQSAITGLQAAGQIAKSLHELSASIDIKTKVIDLQAAILSAQQSALAAQSDQLALIQRVRDLEKEVADIKAWEEEKQRYQLIEPWRGCFVYALKESSKGAEPPHWVCTRCYQEGRKSILNNHTHYKPTYMHVLKCSHCTFENEVHSDRKREYT